MIVDNYKGLLGKTNSNWFLGFPPGTLLVADYRFGGGFSGSPEELILHPLSHYTLGEHQKVVFLRPQDGEYQQVEFPQPSTSIEYHLGGREFEYEVKPRSWYEREEESRRKLGSR